MARHISVLYPSRILLDKQTTVIIIMPVRHLFHLYDNYPKYLLPEIAHYLQRMVKGTYVFFEMVQWVKMTQNVFK